MELGQSQPFASSVSGGTSPFSYQWYLNGSLVSGAVNPSWTFTPVSAGSYTVQSKVTDAVGAVATSNTVSVSVLKHDVAITSVAPLKTVVGEGFSDKLNVTVANYGSYTETFEVMVYANTTIIASQNVTLTSGSSATITFTWNTAGFAYGSYTISASVTLASGETNQWTGPFTDGTITVTVPSDVAITNVTPYQTVIGQGFNDSVSVAVANYGSYTETFRVMVYANTTIIASQNVTLTSGSSATITFTWNTTGFAYGSYTISASVTLASGETNQWTGPFTDSTVKVTIPGDIFGYGVVNSKDVAIIAAYWLQTAPPAPANADILGNGFINSQDIAVIAANWLMQT
jgi:acyl dehydratase